MSTIEVSYVPGDRVEVVSDGTWVPGVVDTVHVFRGGLVSYDVWSEADDKSIIVNPAGVRPALAPGDRVCWASVPGEFEVVLVEGDQVVIRTTYANFPQQLVTVYRSDLRQAPPAPPEAVQPQPEEVR